MSKRLTDLQKQRALLQEHLAWLDREIAAEQAIAAEGVIAVSTPTPKQTSSAAHPSATAAKPKVSEADAEAIMAEYRHDPGSLQKDTRRGCLIAFWLLLLGTLLVAGIGYALYARHLGRWW